jgi:hypothetical protein
MRSHFLRGKRLPIHMYNIPYSYFQEWQYLPYDYFALKHWQANGNNFLSRRSYPVNIFLKPIISSNKYFFNLVNTVSDKIA